MADKREVVVLSAVRAAVGTFRGSLAGMEPADLGGLVVKEAIARSGVDPKAITFATVGNVIPTEARYPMSRAIATIQGGMTMESVAFAVNRLCGSVAAGDRQLGAGDPARRCRFRHRRRRRSHVARRLPDAGDAFRRAHGRHQDDRRHGRRADRSVRRRPHGHHRREPGRRSTASRARMQDDFACESQRAPPPPSPPATSSRRSCRSPSRPARATWCSTPTSTSRPTPPWKSLAKMKPAFNKDGTVTAGNASGINDGAAFLVLADAAKAAAGGHKPMARLVAYAIAGVPNDVMGEGPIPSTKVALAKAGLKLDEIGRHRVQRSLRRPVADRGQGARPRPGEDQPERRRDRHRPPDRRHRRGDHHQAALRS